MNNISNSSREMQIARKLKRAQLDPIRIEGNTIVSGLAGALNYVHGTLLDLGCGDMPYANLMAERTTFHVGTDLRPRPDSPPTVCSDSLYLPFKAESFDTVLCTQVLEHVRDPFKLMHEVSRVLKLNGHAIFTMPATWPLHEEPYDYFRYTRYGLEELSRINGLNIVKLEERGGGIAAIAQLTAALLYDVFGKNRLTRVTMKVALFPLLSMSLLLDRVFYYPKFTLGYLMVARKGERMSPHETHGHKNDPSNS